MDQSVGPEGQTVGNLDVEWIHGSPSPRHKTDPPIQVHQYDPNTFIMRESKDVSYEAPFMYLFFGKERALLLDTGATADPRRFPIRSTVDRLITNWQGNNGNDTYELVVAHTHGHLDHVAGDSQFYRRQNTKVVPKDLGSVQSFFGLEGWPGGLGHLDLGGRVLDVLSSPGHDPRSISLYDPWTGLLVTGDTVYPGRLYAFDFPSFVKSLEHLVAYAETKLVTHVMGCHIEMTRFPGKDYPVTTRYQPEEPPLQMTTAQLVKVRDAARSVREKPGAHRFDDFIIFNGPCHGAVLKQLARGSWRNLVRSLGA